MHHPTDVGFLWDMMRCLIRAVGRAVAKCGVRGWRQWKHLTRRARPEHVDAYLRRCLKPVAHGAKARKIVEVESHIAHAMRQIEQTDRRFLNGEPIPQDEKVFSIFESHTCWIAKGKAGFPVEMGVPVCIPEDRHGFVLHHRVVCADSGLDHAVPMVEAAQARLPDLCAVASTAAFTAPKVESAVTCLVTTYCRRRPTQKKVKRKREQGESFMLTRRRHPAVDSAINNLEHRGLDRFPAYRAVGFAGLVALSVIALNSHRIGLPLRRKAQRRRAGSFVARPEQERLPMG